jgi:hypothetical protein
MSRRSTMLLLWCGALGPPLFVVAALIEGATRRYDAARLPFSLLALGEFDFGLRDRTIGREGGLMDERAKSDIVDAETMEH